MESGSDPYAHLEDGTDPRTQAWTAAQNEATRALLGALPARERLAQRFADLLSIGTLGVPLERGEAVFFTARRGERLLLDPAELDPSGLTALDWWYPSASGKYVAYGLSRNGDERSTLYLLDVAAGATFGESIADTRYCSLAWLGDGAFYYTRYPPGGDYGQALYYHALGRDAASDPKVFGEERPPEEVLVTTISADGQRLAVASHRGWISNDVHLATLERPERPMFAPVVEGRDAIFDVAFDAERLLLRTNDGAPRYRVVAADLADPRFEKAREIVAERPEATLQAFAVARGGIVLSYLRNVAAELVCCRSDGAFLDAAALEVAAFHSIIGLSAREDSHDVYILSVGFLQAPKIERLRFGGGTPAVELFAKADSPLDAGSYNVAQHWFDSKDGTRVPMFVLSLAGTRFDGTAPTILHGYGGFNISLTPSFAPNLVPWLDAGGVYAIANLRGGGEFGEAWHRAGMREHKQNVFDDFIAAAEYLGASQIADPRRIGIAGGSNGGLLVAACLVQRPELFAAVVCAVPLCDMLRYHRFLIARLWIPEYGDPDVSADAAFLAAYSPYHNVREDVAYPATYVVSAESDSRVDPAHARKFAARLQAATTGTAPVLAYIEAHAGHGIGKSRAKQIEEQVDRWSFFGAFV